MLSDHVLQQIIILLKTEDIDTCVQEFIHIAARYLDLQTLYFLRVSVDGRTLNCIDMQGIVCDHLQTEICFNIDDFSHPFSHVIQVNKEKTILMQELIYWRNNSAFDTMITRKGLRVDYHLAPFKSGTEKKMYGLFCIPLEHEATITWIQSEKWSWLLSIFSLQIDRCLMNEKTRSEKQYLTETILKNKHREIAQSNISTVETMIVGQSPVIKKMIDDIVKISSTMVNVFIHGDTGTGKELVARAIHKVSARKNHPLIAINCASIPAHLFESELFGHVKGAFTGAHIDKEGLIAAADQGVLFLDEIGDLPLEIQAKLLRVIETHKYRPVGANEERHSDFRLICATHIDLKQQVEAKLFRRDLFYRVNQYTIRIPALMERIEDLGLLIDHFIKLFNKKYQKNIIGISEESFRMISNWPFEGNVRELKNLIDSACMLTDREILESSLFNKINQNYSVQPAESNELSDSLKAASPVQYLDSDLITPLLIDNRSLKEILWIVEKNIIEKILITSRYNKKEAANILQVPLRTFSHKCKIYRI